MGLRSRRTKNPLAFLHPSLDGIVLGDGCTQRFDVYSARIIWDGKFRTIKVNEADTDSLVGLGLLYGYQMCIQVTDGGSFEIRSLQDET